MFNDVVDAIYWIEHIKRKDKRENLNRMRKFLSLLNNPQKDYKTIHIAGTNGKGATCQIASSILINAGHTVGRFVSPYVLRFNERIVVNNEEISDSDLLRLTNLIYPVVEKYNIEHNDIIPFFEVVTALGFLYFKEKNCDIACIECGLGGDLDATNIIDSKVCVIPSIGYDHMKTLGNTLEEIAIHKLGIVKKGAHLICGVDKSLYNLFDNYTTRVGATLTKINSSDLNTQINLDYTKFNYKGIEYKTNLIGSFEALNSALAIEAATTIDSNIDINIIKKTLLNIFWPGRMEVISKNPLIFLDGGHNISAIEKVVETIKLLKLNKNITVLYTALSDKESDKVIKKLEEVASSFVITTLNDPRAKDPNVLLSEVSIKNKEIILNPIEALNKSVNNLSNNDCLLIIGSLHFVSILRNNLINLSKK